MIGLTEKVLNLYEKYLEKKQGEEFVKGLEEQPFVSSSEFVDLMVD